MKKFISMVMAAAMVVSLVPATAFAADNTCTMKVVNADEAIKEDATGWKAGFDGKAEVQITIGEISTAAGTADTFEIELDFDGAEVKDADKTWTGKITDVSTSKSYPVTFDKEDVEADNEYVVLKFTEVSSPENIDLAAGDIITISLGNDALGLKSVNEGATASVSVAGDLGTADAKTFATVVGQTLKVTARKVVEVGEEEIAALKKVTVKTVKGAVASNEEFTLKLPAGFVWAPATGKTMKQTVETAISGATFVKADDNVLKIKFAADTAEFAIDADKMFIEAVSAKVGAIATLKVSVAKWDSASADVAEVVAAAVKVSVDEDEDIPEIYAGTAVGDAGLTSEGEHDALKVTVEETVVGAWDTVKAFTISLPEGVYVVDGSTVTNAANCDVDTAMLEAAYDKGDFEVFKFGRRAVTIADTTKVAKFELNLKLVAEPGFVGDVVLTVEGDGIGSSEVVIAKFVAPYTVEAAQNDVIIDYRNTEVKTDIVVKEAEAGLWDSTTTDATFTFGMDKGIGFEDSAAIAVDEASEMKIKAVKKADMAFYVDEESNEEAAVVTINGIELYMNRSIPAGAYDLTLVTTMGTAFMAEGVFGTSKTVGEAYYNDDVKFVETVKEGWINVVTAGRDKDDASFTTKVVVPVGEAYLIAGEDTVALDVPAYINAAGYTMLPVRAVATALGIHNNNVIWSQAAKQVTILYGQRIITMTVGQSVIYVNGSAIPASAAVEVVDGRAFLGLRDLANALGVVEINWDAATSTATLN